MSVKFLTLSDAQSGE